MDMSEAKYANLGIEDHDHDDRSSTEVEESLIGGDDKACRSCLTKEYQSPSTRRQNRWLAMLKSSRWFVDTALLLVILGLLVREQMRQPTENKLDFGGDLTGVSGKCEYLDATVRMWERGTLMQIKTFTPDYEGKYAPNDTSKFFTDEVLNNWNELMPIGMGFQWVNDTHKYHDLPTPIVWPEKTVFTTSVTHQLHCLFAVVQTYSGLTSGHEIPDDHHWHMIHCFAYLRQTIMCSADLALEGLETTFPDHNGGSDGWDSKHVCKDYKQVKNYLESVRAYDDREIF
ncbi:oxidase ustYa [Colletotrichum spaethianum]|uniref:Oxidase ustYa n=1 Tax=Colletotrichum spaethianum TaxID=700344 RepID=A0AA37L7R2_9PEZI|nr:oxidase ustYa [Colletotrichum spaethianum]GKT40990.1 oxidase ustYa [Colletotrichum spaethianum]